MTELSKRCKYLESELDKKRAELRELLMQDSESDHDTKKKRSLETTPSGVGNPNYPLSSLPHPTDLSMQQKGEEEEAEYPPFPKRHKSDQHHLKGGVDQKKVAASSLPNMTKSSDKVVKDQFGPGSAPPNPDSLVQRRASSGTPVSIKSRVSVP